MFEEERPDLVVLGHLQTCWVTSFVLAASARSVAILGVNGSWDQPTTKGPLCPGIQRILVQSRQVGAELERYHQVPAGRIALVGWPQMDVYAQTEQGDDRHEFLRRIGVPTDGRYVLVGAYSERLGAHEPKMCAQLAAAIRKGRFGPKCTLYIRPHPLDMKWRDRLGHLHDTPHVIVEAPGLGDLDYLADLLRHAGVLVASAGTINLDAVALDIPSVAIAWEDYDEPFYDRPARRYDMEHYAEVVCTGGVRLVRNMDELETVVEAYLADPRLDAEGRASLRKLHLEPLDGRSSERLVRDITVAAVETRT